MDHNHRHLPCEAGIYDRRRSNWVAWWLLINMSYESIESTFTFTQGRFSTWSSLHVSYFKLVIWVLCSHTQTILNIMETPSKFRLHSPKKSVRHVSSTKRLEPSACTDTFLFQSRVFFVASSLRACTKASQHTYHKSSSLLHYAGLFSTFDTLRCERLLTSFTIIEIETKFADHPLRLVARSCGCIQADLQDLFNPA